jgi:malonyl-CoA/methylmalonyl-CoA synthetase
MDEEGAISADALETRSRATAHALTALGLSPQSRLLWSAATSIDAVIALVAAVRLGAVVVPANVAYTERELSHIVNDVQPSVAVVETTEQADWIAHASNGTVATTTPSDLARAAATRTWVSNSSVMLDDARAHDPALIIYTSGTTGTPKGATLTHANIMAGLTALVLAWQWHPDDRLLLSLPLFHVHGLCAGLFGTLLAGASAVLLSRFEPDALLDVAKDHAGTLFFGVPTLYHRLASSPRAPELSRLRLCVSGSAPLPASLWERFRVNAGVAILERYGMTETLLTVSNPVDGERRAGTVGLALPGTSLRIERAEGTIDTEAGALWVKGPSVFCEYWKQPEATAAAFDGEWFDTGDLALTDDNGYLVIKGRGTELIISGGYNVYPAEVEDVLRAHPGVSEVAVKGLASEEWGESVGAWIVPLERADDLDDLTEFAAARLAPYKRPRRICIVDALPRNAMGKVQKSELS